MSAAICAAMAGSKYHAKVGDVKVVNAFYAKIGDVKEKTKDWRR